MDLTEFLSEFQFAIKNIDCNDGIGSHHRRALKDVQSDTAASKYGY